MLADGDSAARMAFRDALRDEGQGPRSAVNATQELDPNDILEVHDVAEAIARADRIVTAPRNSQAIDVDPLKVEDAPLRGLADVFDTLGLGSLDSSRPPGPPPSGKRATLRIPPKALRAESAITPIPLPLDEPGSSRSLKAASTALEEDAFYHPVGRARSLADTTLDGYRPEPTLLVRARRRRQRSLYLLVGLLLPLTVLAVIGFWGRERVSTTSTTSASNVQQPNALRSPPAVEPTPAPASSPTSGPSDAVPTFDVNSLPAAGGSRANKPASISAR